MGFCIEREERVGDALRRVAAEQIESTLQVVFSDAEPFAEKVHDLRKTCKKVRGLLRLFRPPLGDTYKEENAWFRDTARLLSDLRDAESMIGTYDDLLADYADVVDRRSLAPIRRKLTLRKQDLLAGDSREKLREAIGRLEVALPRLEDWKVDADEFAACAGGLRKTYKRARKALGEVEQVEEDDPEETHEWRKRVKYHWYHLRLIQGIWEGPLGPVTEAADELQELLGDAHDLAVLKRTLTTHFMSERNEERIEAILGLASSKRRKLISKAIPLGRRLFAEEPDAVVSRLGSYWEVWRSKTQAA